MDQFQKQIIEELRNQVAATKELVEVARELLEGLSQPVAILSDGKGLRPVMQVDTYRLTNNR